VHSPHGLYQHEANLGAAPFCVSVLSRVPIHPSQPPDGHAWLRGPLGSVPVPPTQHAVSTFKDKTLVKFRGAAESIAVSQSQPLSKLSAIVGLGPWCRCVPRHNAQNILDIGLATSAASSYKQGSLIKNTFIFSHASRRHLGGAAQPHLDPKWPALLTRLSRQTSSRARCPASGESKSGKPAGHRSTQEHSTPDTSPDYPNPLRSGVSCSASSREIFGFGPSLAPDSNDNRRTKA
jgi:hypothetical protein